MYSDPTGHGTTSLKQDFFYLDDKYYGGNQSWWGNASFGPFGIGKKQNVGCATVAAANIVAYLAKRNS